MILAHLRFQWRWRRALARHWWRDEQQQLAHRLPRTLVYFAAMRVLAAEWARRGDVTPDAIGAMDALEHWGEPE